MMLYHLMFNVVGFYYVYYFYSKEKSNLYFPDILLFNDVIFITLNPIYAIVSVLFSLFLISNYTNDKVYSKIIGFRGNIFARSELGVSFMFIGISSVMIGIMFILNLFYHSTVYRYAKKGMVKKSKKIIEESCEEVKEEYNEVQKKCKELSICVMEIYKEYDYHSLSLENDFKRNKQKIMSYQYRQPHSSVYADSKFATTILESITFGVRPHEIFCLVGPCNSGKSFILNAIAVKENYDTGNLYVNGVSKMNSNMEDVMYSYCPQNSTLMDELTVKEQLMYLFDIVGYPDQALKSYIKDLLKFYNLSEFTNVKIKNLDYESRKILNIIIATANAQQIVLMDEPTQGITSFNKRKYIWERIKQTNRLFKSSILIATSSIEEAAYVCDRMAIINRGRLIFVGTFEQLMTKY
eukprot:jgi/Orpsp1_1/1191163/evm.model.d7180000083889.1